MRLRTAISKIKQARRIHADFSYNLRQFPEWAAEQDARPRSEVVGDPDWHDDWVKVYDTILAKLGDK